MSASGSGAAAAQTVRLGGRLTIATVQTSKTPLLAALQGGGAVELDCAEGTDFDVSFAQLLEAAHHLADREGVAFTLRQPAPAKLLALLAEGGFLRWGTTA
jgi:anti-anti-sigma regulatory factor